MNKFFTIYLVGALLLCVVASAQDRGFATSIAWSPDGKTIAIGSNTGVWFFDMDFNEKGYVATPEMGGYPPSTIDWNATGDLVAIGGTSFENVPILIVDFKVRKVMTVIEDRWVTSTVRWHPKENLFLAGTTDGITQRTFVWDALTGNELYEFKEAHSDRFETNYTQAVCWLTDSTVAILASSESYIVDVEESQILETLETPHLALADCNVDGDIAMIHLYDIVFNLRIDLVAQTYPPMPVYWIDKETPIEAADIAWSPDGRRIAINGGACHVGVFNGQIREQLALLPGSYSQEFTFSSYQDSIAWHPDGSRFAVVGQFDIRMWDAKNYDLLHLFDGFEVGYHETLKSSIGLSEEERRKLMDEKHVNCP